MEEELILRKQQCRLMGQGYMATQSRHQSTDSETQVSTALGFPILYCCDFTFSEKDKKQRLCL